MTPTQTASSTPMVEQSERWMMNKAIFFNFWYYPDQVFTFQDGCAVLRGHNGSGKSVTTQTLITVLLDGDTRSHKLDPFGGKERTLKNTLLGEEGILNINERIGYVAMEFKKGKQEIYKTIGIGVEAERDKVSPKVWYFIIDGKRIGHGQEQVKLYTESKIEGELKKIPHDEKTFRQLIEQREHCGKVFSNREEYADKVNKQLFGFDSMDSYRGLMDLLIQIRSPKLSDNSRPEGVVEVLNDALPQLTNEELRPLTTSIEAIDRIEKDLLTYKKDLKALSQLNQVYVEYNQALLTERAHEYIKAKQQAANLQKEVIDSEQTLRKTKARLEQIAAEKGKLENQLEVYREERVSLGFEEIENITQKKAKAEERVHHLEHKIEAISGKIAEVRKQQLAAMQRRDQYALELERTRKEVAAFIRELTDTASTLHFEEHARYVGHFGARQQDAHYSFTAWKQSLKQYEAFVDQTRKKLMAYEQLQFKRQEVMNELGELQRRIDEVNRQIDALMDTCDREIMNVVENMQQWMHASSALAVPAPVMDQLNRTLTDVFVELDQTAYMQPLSDWYEERKGQAGRDIMKKEQHQANLQEHIDRIRQEIEEWQTKKEIEPFFAEAKKAEWAQLTERHIPFTPFYETVEFVEGLDEATQLNIQNALFESGLLSAVIVPMAYANQAKSYTTVVDDMPVERKNLNEVLLCPDQPDVQRLLSGIPFEETERGYILPSGRFKNGFVEGQSSQIIDTVFIGKAAREAYRQAKIQELEQAYMKVLVEKDQVEQALQALKLHLQQLQTEFAAFPALGALQDVIQQKHRAEQRKADVLEPERERKDGQIEALSQEMKRMMDDIKRQLEWTDLQLTSAAFEEEAAGLKDYSACLSDIERTFIQQANAAQHVEQYKLQLEQHEDYLEERAGDLASEEREKDRVEREVVGYARTLAELGSEDIIARMEELVQQINETIPKALRQLEREEALKQNEAIQLAEQLQRLTEREVPFRTQVEQAWERALGDHLRAGFVDFDEPLRTAVLSDQAKALMDKFPDFLDGKREVLERIRTRLTKRFNELTIDLFHYDMALDTQVAEHVPQIDVQDDENKTIILQLMTEQMQRLVVTMDVSGERVSPAFAVRGLEQRIEDLEREANEKDRDLYERILVNTLGETIRQKVHYVQRWEHEMNKFMEHENLIKFRIKWVPKRSDKEEELHTRDLVEALKKDSKWIDLGEISGHFRSKIKEAKRRHDKQEDHVLNLQQIMREVLDYRKWFDFEIYFTKKGDQERRLTRRTYGELSGGQRVLAMITPVLAALYAKYAEANEDCPRLFTLDEAFSRVDDDNVNVMFEYINKLRFNYILNSQSLWGCFESVPSLDIYELVRPDNRPTVAVSAYYWNGTKISQKERADPGELAVHGEHADPGEQDYELAN